MSNNDATMSNRDDIAGAFVATVIANADPGDVDVSATAFRAACGDTHANTVRAATDDAIRVIASTRPELTADAVMFAADVNAPTAVTRTVPRMSDDDAERINIAAMTAALAAIHAVDVDDIVGGVDYRDRIADVVTRAIRGTTPRGRTVHDVTIADVIDHVAGADGDVIPIRHTYRDGSTVDMVVFRDGTVADHDHTTYDSVSAAATAITGKSTNGWVWFTYNGRTLAAIRDDIAGN